jgi:hypothetical protein
MNTRSRNDIGIEGRKEENTSIVDTDCTPGSWLFSRQPENVAATKRTMSLLLYQASIGCSPDSGYDV